MLAHRPLLRMLFAGLLAPAMALTVGACGGDQPLAPEAIEPEAPTAAAPAPDATAAVPGDLAALTTQRIAFISYRYNDWPNLYTMDPSGGTLVRLTSWAGYAGSPAWSYDNKRIAMMRERLDATNTYHQDIYLMNADGSNKHWARSAPSSYAISNPSWSPDGTHLLVTVTISGGVYLARLTLATGALDFVSLSAGGPAGTQASYDPTGTKIIYVGPNDGATIERINADGTGHKVLFSNSSAHFNAPRYSPDGTRILFSKSVNNDMEVFVKNADGTVKRLTTSPGPDGEASWSPDGSRIAFSSGRSGNGDIYTMPSNGGSATRITSHSNIDWTPVFTH
jgi:Tol biopolymer transport system component